MLTAQSYIKAKLHQSELKLCLSIHLKLLATDYSNNIENIVCSK